MPQVNWSLGRAQEYADILLETARKRIAVHLLDGVDQEFASKIPRIEVAFFETPQQDAGVWSSSVAMIVLNKELLDYSGDAAWWDIIAHEMGHALSDYFFPKIKRHHGKEWRAITKWLGGTGAAKHGYPVNHICVEYPEIFFLYGSKDGNNWTWLSRREHLFYSRKKRPYKMPGPDKGTTPTKYRPELEKKVRRTIK